MALSRYSDAASSFWEGASKDLGNKEMLRCFRDAVSKGKAYAANHRPPPKASEDAE